MTSEQLTYQLMEQTGVALLPGSAFGLARSSLTVRLAFVDFNNENFSDTDISSYDFNKIKQGIERLCHWLKEL